MELSKSVSMKTSKRIFHIHESCEYHIRQHFHNSIFKDYLPIKIFTDFMHIFAKHSCTCDIVKSTIYYCGHTE